MFTVFLNQVFNRTFVSPENSRYLGHITTCYLAKRWTGRPPCLPCQG